MNSTKPHIVESAKNTAPLVHPSRAVRLLIPWAILVAAVAFSLLAAHQVHTTSVAHDQLRFENAVQELGDSLRTRLSGYLGVLRAESGMLGAYPQLSFADYEKFAASLGLERHYPGTQGVGYSVRVPAEEIDELARFAEGQGIEDFHAWPAVDSPYVDAILYLYPLDARNRAALGFNMFSEETRRSAMVQARDTGAPALSGKVTLVQEITADKQPGFLIYVPVYAGNPTTVSERRAQLRGYAYAPFRAGDLFNGIFEDRSPTLTFAVYDGQGTEDSALLYRSGPIDSDDLAFTTVRGFVFGRHQWTILYQARPEFFAVSETALAGATLLAGIFVGFVLFFLSRSQTRAWLASNDYAAVLQHSQQALRSSERQLRMVTNALPALVAYVDREKRYRFNNEAYTQWFGKTPGDLYGMPAGRNMEPESFALVEQHMSAALAGEPQDFEAPVEFVDGSRRHVHASLVPDVGGDGRVRGFVALIRDVSAEKEAEEILFRRERELNALVENSPDIIARYDRSFRLVYVNRAAEVVTGERVGDLIGKTNADFRLSSEALEGWGQALRTVFESGEEASVKYAYETPNGGRYYEARVVPERNRRGEIESVLAVTRDITDLKRAQDRSRRSIERLQILAEGSRAFAAATLNEDAVLRLMSERLTGTLGDLVVIFSLREDGSTLDPVYINHVDPELSAHLREVATQPHRMTGGVLSRVILTRDAIVLTPEDVGEMPDSWRAYLGRHPLFSGMLAALAVQDKPTGLLAVVRHAGAPHTREDLTLLQDLADRAALALENARLFREVTEAVKLRDDFLSIASHELRTPLTPLQLQVQRLARLSHAKLSADNFAKMGAAAEVVSRQVDRLTALINNLLDISRIAAGRLEFEPTETDLSELAAEVVERFRGEAERLKTEMQLEVQPRLVGLWDALRIEQVVTNLVSNALKYGNGNPVTVRTRRVDGKAVLSVSDKGIGLDPAFIHRAFDRFARGVSGRAYGGLGLGLYIVREIVDGHHGHVDVRSTPMEGTTFEVELPLNPPEA